MPEGADDEERVMVVAPDDDDRLEDTINTRRRAAALRELRAHQKDLLDDVGTIEVHDLAHVLAAKEAGIPCEDVYDHNVGWMEKELLYEHLPALDDLGVIEFDLAAATVTVTPALKMFDVVLQGSNLGSLNNPLTRLPGGRVGWISGREYEERAAEEEEHQRDTETGDE